MIVYGFHLFSDDDEAPPAHVHAPWSTWSLHGKEIVQFVDHLGVLRDLIKLEPSDVDPKNFSLLRKWLIVTVISSAALCVCSASALAAFTEDGLQKDFHVSKEVSILSISLFVEGLGIGPLLLGPLSEFYGRNAVYWASYICFWVFTWPVAFAPNIAVHLVFRFICGFAGSAFLSVAGGTMSDLFSNETISTPMAVYTIAAFVGPIVGPVYGGFVIQHVGWRWAYRVQIIWEFTQLLSLVLLVPETYEPIILKRKAKRMRKETGDKALCAPMDMNQVSVLEAIVHSCTRPFLLLFYEPMILLLNIWDAVILGILYLTFQAFSIIFGKGHKFEMQFVGLTFLGTGLGMVVGLASQPFWNRLYKRQMEKYNGHPPPEARLVMGQLGGLLVPLGLVIIAFTSYPHVHWIAPILGCIPFGAGIAFVFTSTFTYEVSAYRPLAASALASNTALRLTFAAVFPLFAGAMYERLGTVGATGLLAALTAVMAPLPFVFYKIGGRLRARSRYAVRDPVGTAAPAVVLPPAIPAPEGTIHVV